MKAAGVVCFPGAKPVENPLSAVPNRVAEPRP